MAENINTTAVTIEDELNSIRSVLRSDEHLQIQPSGDYEQVRIKLDHDIQISFFFDSLQPLSHSLTISNLHDLRISKASTKCPLNQDQWASVRKSFDELVQQSDSTTPLRSLLQLVQDQLLRLRIANPKYKPKEKKTTTSAAAPEDETLTAGKFRGGDLIFNRILHDKTIDRSQVVIGYEDRFTGIHEIAFNEFKKVHDHEYGVPMHRIRYFKIGGRTVWDRTKKLDVLTGIDQQNGTQGDMNDIGQRAPITQGLYQFDSVLEQWVSLPHTSLAADDTKTPSNNDTLLPSQSHILTWNILFDYHHASLIHTQQRYPAILHTLKTLLPDLIALQEVTAPFLRLLLNEPWLQQNNYHIIIMQSVIDSEKDKTYGQIMLMKNFRPRAFSILPLDVSNETATTTTAKKTSKEVIIARFGLSARVTIDVVNLHLHSNRSRNADDKRCQALENLFTLLSTHNYMLVGDFNFGDYDLKEQALLQRHANDVHDLWRDVYDLEQHPGFTFDPSRNVCAQIMSETQIKRRFDRFLMHTLHSVYYSVQQLDMIGIDPIPTDPTDVNDTDKRVNLSDHYGVQLLVDFQTRSISHRSALVVLPTSEQGSLIDEEYRRQYDPSFGRWPAHINVLWPFFDLTGCEDDEESILVPLRLALSECASFEAEVTAIETFVENNICYMALGDESRKKVKGLYEQVKQLFPQCAANRRTGYNPHMTIAQFDNEDKRIQAKSALALKKPFQFPMPYLYILQRPLDNDTTPFHITYQLPLGPLLHPLHSQQLNSVHPQLQDFFQQMHLYEDQQVYQQKQDKFNKLATCFSEMFNSDTLHCFTHAFLPYGSFRIGVKGEDVDTVFVLTEVKTTANKTSFDETLLTLKNDSSALSSRVVDLLETQMNATLKDDIVYYRKVQALYPLIVIMFRDQTKVEIFIQIQTIKENVAETKLQTSPDTEQFIHGVQEIEHLLVHARSPPIFQHLLGFVRTWAQHVGLYGQAYGYLGGYSWAILCAHICHSFLSSIPSLATIEQFTIDDFFALVRSFFSTHAHFNWSAEALRLHPKSSQQITRSSKSSLHTRGSMRILSPTAPYNNTGRFTVDSTRDLIVQGFQRVVDLLDSMNTTTTEEKAIALQEVLRLEKHFPSEKIKTMLQLTLSGADATELDEWVGWMKSRLAHFVNDCENDCHLAVQTQNSVEQRASNNEVVYSIGFQLEETALNHQRNFHHSLTKFVDQFSLCPNRKESMKISYKLVSVHDWKLERMQPKPQRTRK